MNILIIEDEPELSKSIVKYLRTENYICEVASGYRVARDKLSEFDYDCILLDITLPDGNGLHLLDELKKDNKTDGVIIISARNSIEDRIKGLNLGADDYLVKPFHLSELNARISSLIRRRRFEGHKVMTLNEVTIDLVARSVFINNIPVVLTRKEYDLLLYFAANRNRVISKNALAEHLSGPEIDSYDSPDFIYTHIKNLKKKLTLAGWTDNLRSVYGMGYKFEVAL